MSNKSETLREYGRKLQDSPTISTVLMGKYIVDCANRLDQLEDNMGAMRVLIEKAMPHLRLACKYGFTPPE